MYRNYDLARIRRVPPEKGANLGYDWNIELFDLLEYQSKDKFDAIVIMGVIEHLPQYDVVAEKFRALIKPGGRIFLDGSASEKKYDVAKFLVKYIYPGNSFIYGIARLS